MVPLNDVSTATAAFSADTTKPKAELIRIKSSGRVVTTS